MQFFKDGPDVPEVLLEAHEDGKVVFFCGAGISYPAELPGFKGLVEGLYARLAVIPDAEQQAAMDSEQFDTAVALLEQKHPGGRQQVREELSKILNPKSTDTKATATHRALLTLSENREGQRRLITTNFDRLFRIVIRREKLRVPVFQAPLLPVPKARWNGLIYLHGLLAGKPNADNLNSLVVSSGDFGLAYLTERWAARFLGDLFCNFTVCFVGYSIGDPVLRYMMDALAADRQLGESPHEVFAFGSHSEADYSTQTNKWKAKSVTPILYLEDRGHTNLHRTLDVWANMYGDGVSGKENIVVQGALARPVTSTKQDDFVGRVLWALSDPTGLPAKRFAEMNPVPSLEWLEPLSEERFGRNRLAGFGLEPESAAGKGFKFSLMRRPAPYTMAPCMGLVDAAPRGSLWDDVMGHLARWLIRHLNDPALLLWLVKRGGQLDERFARQVEYRIQTLVRLEKLGKTEELDRIRKNAPNGIPNLLMRTLWSMLLAGRVKAPSEHLSLYDWHERLSSDGLTTSLRLEFREKLAPHVALNKPYPRLTDKDEPREAERMREIVEWKIVLATKHVHAAVRELSDDERWQTVLPDLLGDFSGLLRDALDLMRELGEAEDASDNSYVHQPSISEHPQNREFQDWTALVELTRDAWRATAAQSPERARITAEAWRHIHYPLFRRLTFFAASHTEIIPCRLGLGWLLEDECWWLWSEETTRESIRLLVALVPLLSEAEQRELETAVLAGPPDAMLEGLEPDLYTWFRNKDICLRLAKMAQTERALGTTAKERLADLSVQYTALRLADDERHEFTYWMPDSAELREVVALPQEPNELVEWLKEERSPRPWETDDWPERCREDFCTAAWALRTAAEQGSWPVMRWRTALHAWSEEALTKLAWEYLSPLLEKAPTVFLSEARHVLAWWLREIAQTFEARDTTFLLLCERVLRLEYDGEQDTDDVVGTAINHPIGRVTDALLRWWYRNALQDDQGLPEELNRIFTEVCEPSVDAYRHGRVLLASRVITLFRVDREWTRQHLLPLFRWRDSELEARSAWEGFLWAPQLYGPLMEVIKPAFLETANKYGALGKHGRQYASVLVYASLDPRDIFNKPELAVATSALPSDGLAEAAAALVRAIEAVGEERAGFWKNRVAPYLREIWPKTRAHASPAVAECIGLVCIAARDAFPMTLSQISGWLQRLNYPDQLVRRLNQETLCERFPERALEFLHLTVEDGPQSPPSGLPECLRAILCADPGLESDHRFRRLRDYLRRFGIDLD